MRQYTFDERAQVMLTLDEYAKWLDNIVNKSPGRKDTICPTARQTISAAFTWSATVQGDTYWSNIAMRCEKFIMSDISSEMFPIY